MTEKRDRTALRQFRLDHLGEPCDLCDTRPGVVVHHKKFRSQGGHDDPDNLMWLCLVCHGRVHGIPVKL